MEFLFDLPHASAVLPVLELVTDLNQAPAVVGGNIKVPPPPPKFSFEIDTSEAPMVSGDIVKNPPPPPK